MTKAVGEKVIIQANDLSEHTRFVCIRGGNVMGSNGSVIPFFIEQIKSGGPVTITDYDMTRFFLTLNEAIALLFKAADNSIGGETFVMKMPSCYIEDVASALMKKYGSVAIKDIGIRPGEKLEEVLISKNEANLSYCYDDNYYVILPNSNNVLLKERYSHLEKFPYEEFSSSTFTMEEQEITSMLNKGGFL
jgi:FlaA1/EpsC-like NDP-sugar epimerase